MSVTRLMAVGVIFLVAVAGWIVLGTTTAIRSTDFMGKLKPQVENLWGAPIVQEPPTFGVEIPGTDKSRWLMPSSNDVSVTLTTDYRQRGLIWYPTYICNFAAVYTIANNEEAAQKVKITFNFPSQDGTYDNFSMSLDDRKLTMPVSTREGISEIIELKSGESRKFGVTYRTRGTGQWVYRIDKKTGRVQNLNLSVATNFRDVDFPEGALSPMVMSGKGDGMDLRWTASDLISSQDVGVIIPEKINPGPLTSRITFFAPVCLLFFFLLIGTINILYKVDIHPMHYMFVAAGFFAFHLLLSYMAGIVNIHVTFAISALTSVVLVTSYMAAALKGRFPWKVAVAGQLFYLVLFSYTFFLKGMTGLIVAVGSVVTLAVLMRVTAHIEWSEVFAGRKKTPVCPPAIPESENASVS